MRAQEKLGVVEIVKIVDGRAGAETNALDLLQVDEEDLLLLRRNTAVFDTGEALLDGTAEVAVKERGRRLVVYFIISLFRGVVVILPPSTRIIN